MCVPLPLCPFCGCHVLRLPCIVCFGRQIAELERKAAATPMPKLGFLLLETPDVNSLGSNPDRPSPSSPLPSGLSRDPEGS